MTAGGDEHNRGADGRRDPESNPPRGDAGETRPSVSVVIPTYNRRARLRRVLELLRDQDIDEPFEVIVVSDGSTDGTEDDLAESDLPLDLTWATQANAGPAAARNRGADMARGDLIVFLDDDVLPDARLLSAHVAAQRRLGPSAVVIGPMLNPSDHPLSPWVAWEQRMLYKQYEALRDHAYEPTFRQFYTGNASMRRCDLLDAGGFDTQYRRAEDIELGIRLFDHGAHFAYEPAAEGYHYAERSFEAWRSIARAYGAMEVEFGRDGQRPWQNEFISASYRNRHPALRLVVRFALRFPHAVDSLVGRSAGVIGRLDRSPAARLAQWLLSAIYATDYWRATAEALGGRHALDTLVREYRPAPGQKSATPLWDEAKRSPAATPKGTA